jgi:hypothetical protein
MAATIEEAGLGPASFPKRGPQKLVAQLAGGDSPLSVQEAAELVAAWLEPPEDLGERPRPARRCRCDHPIALADDRLRSWARCLLCGHDVEEAIT